MGNTLIIYRGEQVKSPTVYSILPTVYTRCAHGIKVVLHGISSTVYVIYTVWNKLYTVGTIYTVWNTIYTVGYSHIPWNTSYIYRGYELYILWVTRLYTVGYELYTVGTSYMHILWV